MKHLAVSRCLLYSLVLAGLFAATSATASEDQTRIKLGTLAPKGSIYHRVLQEMGEKWRRVHDDSARFVIYTDGSQGGETDIVRRMRVGQLNAALLTAVGLAEIDRAVRALQYMPMVFRSWKEVDFVAKSLHPMLERRLMERGYVVLFWAEAGWVQLFSNKPARTPEDFKRLKIFAWTGDADQVAMMKSMGYHPVVLETTDILPAMQSGLIDAAPVTALYGLATQLFRSAPHMLRVNYVPIIGAALVTKKAWDGMHPNAREALRVAAQTAETKLRAQRELLETKAIEAMTAHGLTVHELDPITERAWRQHFAPKYGWIRNNQMPSELFDRTQQLLTEFRAGENGG